MTTGKPATAGAAQVQIVHLSDPHLVPPGTLLYGLDPGERLRRVLAVIAARHAPGAAEEARLLVLSGDLAHAGEEEAYRALAELLRHFPLPVGLMIGNHDDRAAFQRVFPDAPRDAAGFVQQAIEAGPVRLLLLDTVAAGRPHGELCPARLAWLADRLAEDDRPVVLALHHPPFATGLQRMDCLTLAAPEALWQTIAPHRARILHLLFGHLHRPVSGSWRGIPFSIPRGTAHQVAFDLARSWRLPVPGSHEPPGYALLRLGSDSVVVHHVDALDESARFDLSPIFIAEGQEPAWLADLRPDLAARGQALPTERETAG